MAILAPILAFFGRFVGKLVETALGWATVLLFGRIPESKRLLLSAVTLGSIVWVAVLIGTVSPDVGTLLVAATPAPDFVRDEWIRVAMTVAALTLPLVIGLAGVVMMTPEARPRGLASAGQVLRGYPYALVLALTLVFLIVVAPIRKLRSIVKRWDDAHIPVVVKPGGYEQVADDLEAALDRAGLPIERARAPVILETPSKLLALAAGGNVRSLVPDRLLVLKGRGLDVTFYPSDLAIAGSKEQVARARAAIASSLTFTEAYLTTSLESQALEDRLEAIATARDGLTWRALDEIDAELARLVVPHEDWEVLYRQRLQVERMLRRRADEAGKGNGRGPFAFIGDLIQQLIGPRS